MHSPISPLMPALQEEDQHRETARSIGINANYLEDNLIARSLSKISIAGSTLVSMILLAMGF